jgi:tetratricopeptide (TPR) repeat protein
MLKTNDIYFFDAVDFEKIIHHYLDSGKNSLARKAIQIGLNQHPNSVILKLAAAELLIFEGALEKAAEILKELNAIEPANGEVYVQQATIFSKKGEHQKAINSLKTALVYADDDADILSMIGMEYLFLDEYEQARLNFAKCLDADYEDYSSLYNIIYCFDMKNQHTEAIDYLNNYIEKDPYSEVAWHQLGCQYFILQDYKAALKAFEYAILIDDCFVGAYLELAKTCERMGRYEEAIESYKATIELDDPTSFVFLRLGKCHEQLHRHSLAIHYYQKAVREDPLLDKGWLAIADLNIRQKAFAKAAQTLGRALEIDEHNPLYWRPYAHTQVKLHNYQEAVRAFRQCVALQDLSIDTWTGLCDALCALENLEEALQILQAAKQHFTDFADIEYRLGAIYYLLGNARDGQHYLQRALEIDFDYHIILPVLFPMIQSVEEVNQIIAKFKDTSL